MTAHVQHGLGGPHPDDEDVEYEMNRELGNLEQREINRRVKWAQQKAAERDARDAALGVPDATVIGNAAVRIRNTEKEQA